MESPLNPRSVTGVVNLLVEGLLCSVGAAITIVFCTLARQDGGAGFGFDLAIRGSAVAAAVLLVLLALVALGRIALGIAGAEDAGALRLRRLLRLGTGGAFTLFYEFAMLARIWLVFRAGNYLGAALGTLLYATPAPLMWLGIFMNWRLDNAIAAVIRGRGRASGELPGRSAR